jgi:hypothetical protein
MRNRIAKAMATVVGSVALLSPLAVGIVGNGTAGAVPVTVSPVGSYNVDILGLVGSTLTIKSNGHFGFPGGPHGTWSETKNVLQMNGTLSTFTYVFVIHQIGVNLGSPKKLGTVTLNGAKWGKWYGVRI